MPPAIRGPTDDITNSDAEPGASSEMTWRCLSKRVLRLATPPLLEPIQSIVIRQAKQNHRQEKGGVSDPPIRRSGHHRPLGHADNARPGSVKPGYPC
jgi:hypothetical protein